MVESSEVQSILADMVKALQKEYAPERVILFGSYAYGHPNPDSDIDLLIIKSTNDRFLDRWSTVRRILSKPRRKTPLEVIVLTPDELDARLAHGDQFLAEIMEKGEVLYAA